LHHSLGRNRGHGHDLGDPEDRGFSAQEIIVDESSPPTPPLSQGETDQCCTVKEKGHLFLQVMPHYAQQKISDYYRVKGYIYGWRCLFGLTSFRVAERKFDNGE